MSMPKPEEIISQEDPDTGGEFSGVGGLVQPLPHDPGASATEALWLLRSRAENP